jgi:hypothetical protein
MRLNFHPRDRRFFTPEAIEILETGFDAIQKELGLEKDDEIIEVRFHNLEPDVEEIEGGIKVKTNVAAVDSERRHPMVMHFAAAPAMIMLPALAHEMSHVKQIKDGRLVHMDHTGICFDKVMFTIDTLEAIHDGKEEKPYKDLPWEAEAFEQTQRLLRISLEALPSRLLIYLVCRSYKTFSDAYIHQRARQVQDKRKGLGILEELFRAIPKIGGKEKHS